LPRGRVGLAQGDSSAMIVRDAVTFSFV
jgi:hypothetical protein